MKEIEFSSKFAQKMKFLEKRGDFELKLSFWDAIKSIRGIKIWILILKTLSSPSLVSLSLSQTDGTENGQKLISELISGQTH